MLYLLIPFALAAAITLYVVHSSTVHGHLSADHDLSGPQKFHARPVPRIGGLGIFVGLAGMPRRIPDYNLQFADFNMVSSIGAFLFGTTQLFFLFIVIKTIRGGPPAPAKPWDGAEGLEWNIPSPAPYHTFTTPPEVK